MPQGGPYWVLLLFTIYLNDTVQSITCDLFLYADDSTLVSGKDPREVELRLSKELASLSAWLENKLSLHLGKTESILFASMERLGKVNKMSVFCNNVNISSKSNIKYLGVTLDQYMAGTSMGTSVVKKYMLRSNFYIEKGGVFYFKKRRCYAWLYFN